MKQTIKSQTVVDSSGVAHCFSMLRVCGGYKFTWDNVDVDWSFTVHGFYQALSHFDHICGNVADIDHMNNWVFGD